MTENTTTSSWTLDGHTMIHKVLGTTVEFEDTSRVFFCKPNESITNNFHAYYHEEGAYKSLDTTDSPRFCWLFPKNNVNDNTTTVHGIYEESLLSIISMITVNGEDNVEHTLHDDYVDSGAIAYDNNGDSLTVTVYNNFDKHRIGSYFFVYCTIDSSGNEARAVRKIDVQFPDNVQPPIVLKGGNTVNVQLNTVFTDPGAVNPIGFDVISTSDDINVATVGTYKRTYMAQDSYGNTASNAVRTIKVIDTVGPVITINGDAWMDHQIFKVYVDDGATALDNGVEVSVMSTGTVDSDAAGMYTITYTATDTYRNSSTIDRIVTVKNMKPPVITLYTTDESTTVNVNDMSSFVAPTATALDTYSATALDTYSATVEVQNDSISSVEYKAGSYTITYSATDRDGNTGTRTHVVNVVDTERPVITLNGEQTVTVDIGQYAEQGATASDNSEQTVTVEISAFDSNNPVGQYSVTYTATDSSGNEADAVTRIVTVVDLSVARKAAVIANEANWKVGLVYYTSNQVQYDDDILNMEGVKYILFRGLFDDKWILITDVRSTVLVIDIVNYASGSISEVEFVTVDQDYNYVDVTKNTPPVKYSSITYPDDMNLSAEYTSIIDYFETVSQDKIYFSIRTDDSTTNQIDYLSNLLETVGTIFIFRNLPDSLTTFDGSPDDPPNHTPLTIGKIDDNVGYYFSNPNRSKEYRIDGNFSVNFKVVITPSVTYTTVSRPPSSDGSEKSFGKFVIYDNVFKVTSTELYDAVKVSDTVVFADIPPSEAVQYKQHEPLDGPPNLTKMVVTKVENSDIIYLTNPHGASKFKITQDFSSTVWITRSIIN
jgi:hypothetical protein